MPGFAIGLKNAARIAAAISLLAALAGCSASGAEKAPDDWATQRRPEGFEVRAPKGWQIAADENSPIVIRSADGASFATVQPFLALNGMKAQDFLRRVPADLAALFPDGQVSGILQRSQSPDEATAEMHFTRDGKPMTAHLQCSIAGRGGMFYSIAAPSDSFEKARPDLVKALASFRFTKPEPKPAPVAPKVAYETFRDPKEGAFTVEVPSGWKVDGGAYRAASVDVRFGLRAVSPDGKIRIVVGDPNTGTFTRPNAMLSAGGFRPGSTYSPGYGVSMVVREYEPGAAYAKAHVKNDLSHVIDDVKLGAAKAHPEMTAAQNAELDGLFPGMNVRYDAGDIRYSGVFEGTPMTGYYLAVTLLANTQGGGGIWNVPVSYNCLAAAGQEELANEVLAHVVGTFKEDPSWTQRQGELAMKVSHIVTQTNQEIMSIWKSAQHPISRHGLEGESVDDHIRRIWGNAILGQETVKDPETGEVHQVESGHNFYFSRGTGSGPEFAGNNSGDLPDYRYHEVIKIH